MQAQALYRKLLPHERPRPGDQARVSDEEWIDTADLQVITSDIDIRRPVRLANPEQRYLDTGEVYSMTDMVVSAKGLVLVNESMVGPVNWYPDFEDDDPIRVVRTLVDTILLDDDGSSYSVDIAPLTEDRGTVIEFRHDYGKGDKSPPTPRR